EMRKSAVEHGLGAKARLGIEVNALLGEAKVDGLLGKPKRHRARRPLEVLYVRRLGFLIAMVFQAKRPLGVPQLARSLEIPPPLIAGRGDGAFVDVQEVAGAHVARRRPDLIEVGEVMPRFERGAVGRVIAATDDRIEPDVARIEFESPLA